MIAFDCSQCGNQFRVSDDLEGRHGWCRVCKALIVVPSPDAKLPFNKLPAELRVKTLEKLLRHAGIRYEQDRKIMSGIQRQLDDLREEHKAHEGRGNALASLEARFEDAQGLIASLQDDVSQAANSRGRAEEALRQIERRLEESQQEQSRLSREMQALQDALDERNAVNARLKEELASLASGDETAQQSRFVELGDELGRLQAELSSARDRQRELEDNKTWLGQRVDALEKECQHHRDEAERLRVLAAQSNETERELLAMTARYDEVKLALDEMSRQVAETSDKLGRADTEVTHLEEERKQLRQALVNAKEEVDGFEAKVAELALLRDQTERLRSDADENRAARIRLEGAVGQLESELASAREELSVRLREAVEVSGEDTAKAMAEMQAAEAEARHEASDNKRKAEDAERQLARLQEEHEAMRERAGDAARSQDAVRLVEARLEEAQRQIDSLTKRVADQARALALAESEPDRPRTGADPVQDTEARDTVSDARGFTAMGNGGRVPDDTLVPELLDEDGETDDALMDALLRFIGQQG